MSLDPKTNRAVREAKKIAQKPPAVLEPPFPFVRRNFDPFHFGVQRLPTGQK